MIYYCMYRDICSNKKCTFQELESESSPVFHYDLTTTGFFCTSMKNRRIRLVSDERIICDRYQECNINCIFKTKYLTVSSFKKYFWRKPHLPERFRCYRINKTINLIFAGKNTNNYISVWN